MNLLLLAAFRNPCQDISIAGKGIGINGERSGLWFEMQRIIGELRPRYAIMENVPALTFRGLDRVLGSLADIGYDAEWTVISARDIGFPQPRKRLWIVAYPYRRIEPERMGSRDEFSNPNQNRYMGDSPLKEGQQSRQRRASLSGAGSLHFLVKSKTLPNREQCLKTFEPEFVRVVDGIPNQLDRIGACGNSIVPQIAELIFRLCNDKILDTK